jgi:biopolymer transport protein TolQ
MTLSTLALFFQDATTTLANPPLGAPPAGANSSAFTEMIHNSGPMALAVLGILLVCSIFSWSIMISKWRSFGACGKTGRTLRSRLPQIRPAERNRRNCRPVPAESAGHGIP